jgi:tellurite resistance-related uncharacterized protein
MEISDILLYDETIFKDMSVFNSDYIPEEFNLRHSQMEEMALSLRPAFLRENLPITLFSAHLLQVKLQLLRNYLKWPNLTVLMI